MNVKRKQIKKQMVQKPNPNHKKDTKKTIKKKEQGVEITQIVEFPNIDENKKIYFGYNERILFYTFLLLIFTLVIFLLVNHVFNINNDSVLNYQENGNLDYKVYLKPNDFYEKDYLEKDMVYIASLIKNIDVNMYYTFAINEKSNIDLTYEVIGKLSIYNESGNSKLFEKEYTLLNQKELNIEDQKEAKLSEKLSIDYDYYNTLANSFKSTYGVDATSDLIIYVKVKKGINDINLSQDSEMLLTIPLTEKTINITMDNQGINTSKSLFIETGVSFLDVICIILLVITSIITLVIIAQLTRLLLMLKTNKSKYDKYIERILKEYDRLIVETPTVPNFEDKKIIKINKFEELLDVRDNVKKPIIYHNLVKHHKSYFYVEQYSICYLLTLKASDIEVQNEKN